MSGATCPTTRTVAFGPLAISWDARVLEPRPWTVLQSRWAAELAASAAEGPLLELCAGAGQIGLTAAVLANRSLVQVEADPVAAGFARRNAEVAGWADRVDVRAATMETALTAQERFPIILADPPYLPTTQIDRWPDDPVRAIDGGADGLAVIRTCLRVAARHLDDHGSLLLQVAGVEQAQAVIAELRHGPDLGLHGSTVRAHDDCRAVMLITRNDAALPVRLRG